MPDYKELYLKMFRTTEQAINLLIKTQKECEELYIASSESEEAKTTKMISFQETEVMKR